MWKLVRCMDCEILLPQYEKYRDGKIGEYKMRSRERERVYELIDGERDYQDSLGPNRRAPSEVPRTVGDYCTMLRHYVNKLDDAWTQNPGVVPALDIMRKVAGIAVHCMEDHISKCLPRFSELE